MDLHGVPDLRRRPFERIGVETTTALWVAFLAACLAEVVVAVMLLAATPHAAFVGYALLVLEVPFWVGFALPFGPLLGMARTALLILMGPTSSAPNGARSDSFPPAGLFTRQRRVR